MSSVLKISDAASIGLHAMILLTNKPDELLSVKDIADRLGVSLHHLSKVMQRLVKAGLVVSIKGNKGGFRLALKPESISFLDVYEAIDGKFRPSSCLLNRQNCEHKCLLGGLISSLNTQVEEYFKNTKLIAYKENT